MQKKIYAIAGTIVLIGSSLVALNAGGKFVNDSIDKRITVCAERVADSCDSVQCVKRIPIDSMILAKLNSIDYSVKKGRYFDEVVISPADYAKAQSSWVRDSLRFARGQ